jgi:peptidoglycan/xylan/chitin deacetylase (PgdA/CDA1 family)
VPPPAIGGAWKPSSSEMEPRVIPILAYHSIGTHPSRSIQHLTVTPEAFSAQMLYLQEAGFTALTVRELVAARQAPHLPAPELPVAITFDDGFADFAEHAVPSLKAVGFTATLFVTLDLIEPGLHVNGTGWRPPDPMLTWSQVEAIQAEGFEIGGHGCSHLALDALPLHRVSVEVQTCKQHLEERLGAAVPSFAYPFGYATRRVRQVVIDAGYSSACGMKQGLSSWEDDLYELTRLAIYNSTSLGRFVRWVQGQGVRIAPRSPRLRTRARGIPRRARASWKMLPSLAPAPGGSRSKILPP